eukprot:9971452-Heterocapsa_arctica.AAC.1
MAMPAVPVIAMPAIPQPHSRPPTLVPAPYKAAPPGARQPTRDLRTGPDVYHTSYAHSRSDR